MVKYCVHHPNLVCYQDACSSLDVMGSVIVCSLVPDKVGYFMPRKSVPVFRCVFSKHSRRRVV
jgi:hypothetical protein